MRHHIDGIIAQTLHLELDKGESCWASKGSIVSLDQSLDWQLKIPGGLGGALRRGVAGEGLALTFITAGWDAGTAVLGANQAGKIEIWDLETEGPVLATRGAFLAAIGDIDITVTVARRVGAAFFGGAGLFLQKLSGRGLVFIHGSGDFLPRMLKSEESLVVSSGNLAAFSEAVDYRIRGVGGCRKIFFGGEGVFMTELSGPGRVLLQSLKRRTAGASQPGSGSR